jgi:hypothetical protein
MSLYVGLTGTRKVQEMGELGPKQCLLTGFDVSGVHFSGSVTRALQ